MGGRGSNLGCDMQTSVVKVALHRALHMIENISRWNKLSKQTTQRNTLYGSLLIMQVSVTLEFK